MINVITCAETRTISGEELKIYQPIPQHDLDYIIHLINNELLEDDLIELGRGQFGKVYGYKDYAIKESRRHRWSDLKEPEDAMILKGIQHLDFIPRLYATYGIDYMIVSRVRGVTVEKFLDMRQEGKNLFIHPKFNDAFKEMLRDIVQAGYEPHDLHVKNVMIDSKTGMPVIVDVGFFEEYSERRMELFRNREKISFDMSPLRRAIGWICDKTEKYITTEKEREYKKDLNDQVDAIHNPADIGEIWMHAKEQERNDAERRLKHVERMRNGGAIGLLRDLQMPPEGVMINMFGGKGFSRRKAMPDIDIDFHNGLPFRGVVHRHFDVFCNESEDNRTPLQKLMDSKKNRQHFFQPWKPEKQRLDLRREKRR